MRENEDGIIEYRCIFLYRCTIFDEVADDYMKARDQDCHVGPLVSLMKMISGKVKMRVMIMRVEPGGGGNEVGQAKASGAVWHHRFPWLNVAFIAWVG